MTTWKKLGLVYRLDGQHPVLKSHSANPVPEHLGGNRFRVYFGARDAERRSHIASIEIELLEEEARVIDPNPRIELTPGPLGAFDDSGTSMGCLVQQGSQTWLYYLGWNLGVTVPWRNFIGLAIRNSPAEPFQKYSLAPLVDRSAADPYTISYPFILNVKGTWRMWYGSNLTWGRSEADMDHVIKTATSADGLHWQRDGATILRLTAPGEYAMARPWVIHERGRYRMWVSHRGTAYRLGYAESDNGVEWTWKGSAGLDPSPSTDAWDHEMICYPCVIRHNNRLYLFYNGNRYGMSGFGLAVST